MSLKQELRECTWQEFERIIKEVLELHHFRSYWNVNLTINGIRRQFDVVARKSEQKLLIECKKWKNKKTRKGKLRNEVSKHLERTDFFNQFTGGEASPLIVTYKKESIREHAGVSIVPIRGLDDYLLTLF